MEALIEIVSVLIYVSVSVRTVETQMGFEVSEPTALVLANYFTYSRTSIATPSERKRRLFNQWEKTP